LHLFYINGKLVRRVTLSKKAKSPIPFSFGEGARRADEVEKVPEGRMR